MSRAAFARDSPRSALDLEHSGCCHPRHGTQAAAVSERCTGQVAAACDGDERTGLKILERALEAPTCVIADNSGYDDGVVVERMRTGTGNQGFDASRGVYCDLVEPASSIRRRSCGWRSRTRSPSRACCCDGPWIASRSHIVYAAHRAASELHFRRDIAAGLRGEVLLLCESTSEDPNDDRGRKSRARRVEVPGSLVVAHAFDRDPVLRTLELRPADRGSSRSP